MMLESLKLVSSCLLVTQMKGVEGGEMEPKRFKV